MDGRRWESVRAYMNGLKPLATLQLESGSGAIHTDADFFSLQGRAPTPETRVLVRCQGELVGVADGRAMLLLTGEDESFPSTGRAYDLTLSGHHPQDGPWLVEAPLLQIRTGARLGEPTPWAFARPHR
jgi:hypothetical protein